MKFSIALILAIVAYTEAADDGTYDKDKKYLPIPYEYESAVHSPDETYGPYYSTHQKFDGAKTIGGYKTALPDGRIQIVTYHVDHETGYKANVRYEGKAHYPLYGARSVTFAPTHDHHNGASLRSTNVVEDSKSGRSALQDPTIARGYQFHHQYQHDTPQ